MLRFRTGMIGLPLRLLAREIYDRVVVSAGAGCVALVTGEEKIVPPQARYWICTVEAMPLDRPVAFLAVDEVQLCAHRERGHVFTDRLLHARGLRETWFLGSETIAPLMEDLVPTARFETHPRFSRLAHTGWRKLDALPPRSAVVAFSIDEVYALAERLKARHGGTAVVLGALAPRTRNAQVELFQGGEVQYMVATDAIGMGLNLDLDHVALASLAKFDGHETRPLEAAELAQVAGRAGRYRRDGTFGTTAELPALPEELAQAVEEHRFPPLRFLWYRNSELDFTSPDALRASLRAEPRRAGLRRVRDAEDERSLEALLRREDVVARARGTVRLALLW
ncbi:MAG: helicase-related protein, partial [Pseudomonadota bacterium]